MEKALEQPKNVGIYKQHWDHYSRIAGGLEKLSRENPVQHHLLRHFKENFWHLVERQQEAEAAVKQEIAAATVPSPEQSLQEESRANNFSENFSSELSSILPAMLAGSDGPPCSRQDRYPSLVTTTAASPRPPPVPLPVRPSLWRSRLRRWGWRERKNLPRRAVGCRVG